MNSIVDFKEISELDLEPIKRKLMHLESGEGWTLEQANAVEVEYRRFLYLMKKFPTEQTSPSVAVDTFWHYHILDTMKYAVDCEHVFGYFLHHYPYVGMVGEDAGAEHHSSGERMRELYEQTFAVSYNPGAAFCGIVGLKPTYGLVSRRGVFPLSFTLDHIGPMTRTVADNALMLQAIAGHDPLDPGSAASANGHYAASLDRGVRDLRIGFVRHFHEVDTPAEAEVTAALNHVARALQMEGAEVRDIRLPTLTEFGAVNRVILQSEAWAIHGPWLRERPGDYGQLARRRLMAGAFMNAGDYVQAQRRRLEMIAEVEAAFRHVDVLLCASSMDPPCRIDRPADVDRTYPRQARTPFNVTGHPALAMLAGLSVDGLPLSVQFVGRYFEESTLFQVARAWEHAAGTDKKHPPIV